MIEKYSSISFTRPLVIGTRGSSLARWQTEHVAGLLRRIVPELEIEVRIYRTSGDQDQTRSLADFGGIGVFTKEIEHALLEREIDLAVHSLKDLPTEIAPGLVLAAIPEREDPRDCIVSRHGVGLEALDPRARIGTSSARRTGQIRMLKPDAEIVPLRGNVDTRLRKAATDEYDAIVLAAAGITRLGRAAEITEYLPLELMLPDPGQGALAIEIRADDSALADLMAGLDNPTARAAVTAERAFLQALGGGCRMPIGAYSELTGGRLSLRGLVASLDGKRAVRGELDDVPERAVELGHRLAEQLMSLGAKTILNPAGATFLLPLHGKRILVTRAAGQASALSDRIRALGGEPVELPTIAFAPPREFFKLDATLARAREFDWLIFTSANGVEAVSARLAAQGRELSSLAGPRVVAIGPATRQALENGGLDVAFVPARYLGEQIAVELPATAGESALLLRADIASPVLADGLTARGVHVTNIVAYRTIQPNALPVDLNRLDAVTFTSSSTVRHFVALAGKVLPEYIAVFCIGPVTAATARELGLHVDASADEHTVEGLVKSMVRYYASESQGRNHA